MKLTQLKYFVSIVEAGGFLAASRKVNIAQPALSRQINELELEIGATLLERSNRGTGLTHAGRRFYNRARAILEQVEMAKSEALNDSTEPVGEVRIAMPITAAGLIAPKFVRLIAKQFPQITISIVDGLGHESAHVMEAGSVDFGLVPNGRDLKNADCKAIFEEDMFLVSRREGAGHDGEPISFRQLERIKLVSTGRAIHLRRHLEAEAAKVGITLNVAYEQQSTSSILGFVREGLASTVFNWPAIQDYWKAGIIDARPIVRPEPTRTLSLAIPRARPLTIASEAVFPLFHNLLIDEVRSGYWKGRVLDDKILQP